MGKAPRQLTSGPPDLRIDNGLPANIDAEKTILGAMLLNENAFFDDCEDLTSDDFALDAHRRIFLRMAEIMEGLVESHHLDIVTLANQLAYNKEIEYVGGVAYLASLTEGLPRRPVISEYVKIVKDKCKLRRIMRICSTTLDRAADQSETAQRVLGSVQEQLVDVEAEQKSDAVKASEVVGTIEKALLSRRNENLDKTALDMTWGIEALDVKTKGLFGGELTVIAADSGGFKTQLMMQLALENAKEGTPVGIFSLEMPKEKLIQRLYPLMSEILTADHMRDPRLMNAHTHLPELSRVSAEIAKLPLWIDDTSPLTVQKLRARAKGMRRKHKVKIVCVDYLQLLEFPNKIASEETKGVVFGLRDLAKSEPDVAVVALSQFSKQEGFVKKRRRTKGDLYGGSAIHHAAQNVIIVTVEDSEKRAAGDDLDVEIMVDKSREGGRGRVTCTLDRKKLRFISQNQQETLYGSGTGNGVTGKDRAAGN